MAELQMPHLIRPRSWVAIARSRTPGDPFRIGQDDLLRLPELLIDQSRRRSLDLDPLVSLLDLIYEHGQLDVDNGH